jgi:hypothetical protein
MEVAKFSQKTGHPSNGSSFSPSFSKIKTQRSVPKCLSCFSLPLHPGYKIAEKKGCPKIPEPRPRPCYSIDQSEFGYHTT